MTTFTLPRFPAAPPPHPLGLAPIFAQLQEHDPVARIDYNGAPAWLITRYHDARYVLSRPEQFSREGAEERNTLSLRPTGLLSDMDGADHQRQRRLVTGFFTPRAMEGLRGRIRRITDACLDELTQDGPVADFVTHVALPLPVTVICELLGVPQGDRMRFRHWGDAFLSSGAFSPEEVADALAGLRGYIRELIGQRRRDPSDDLLGDLVRVTDVDHGLTEDELTNLALGTFVAGYETTASQLTNILYTLLTRPELWRWLREHPESVPAAVEELMRYVPLASDLGLPRIATTGVNVGGTAIEEGATVFIARPTANRDPLVYDDPETISFTREKPAPHLGFGWGAHHCVGALLARAELEEAIAALLRRLPALRIAVAEEDIVWKKGMLIRGVEALPVTWRDR